MRILRRQREWPLLQGLQGLFSQAQILNRQKCLKCQPCLWEHIPKVSTQSKGAGWDCKLTRGRDAHCNSKTIMISVDNYDYDLAVGSPVATNMIPHFPDKKKIKRKIQWLSSSTETQGQMFALNRAVSHTRETNESLALSYDRNERNGGLFGGLNSPAEEERCGERHGEKRGRKKRYSGAKQDF